MNIFKNWFKKSKKVTEKQESKSIKSIKPSNFDLNSISQFDDVWIKIDNKIYEGWVVDRIENNINIVYSDSNNKLQDAFFKIERPFNRNYITQNNKTLLLTNETDV